MKKIEYGLRFKEKSYPEVENGPIFMLMYKILLQVMINYLMTILYLNGLENQVRVKWLTVTTGLWLHFSKTELFIFPDLQGYSPLMLTMVLFYGKRSSRILNDWEYSEMQAT